MAEKGVDELMRKTNLGGRLVAVTLAGAMAVAGVAGCSGTSAATGGEDASGEVSSTTESAVTLGDPEIGMGQIDWTVDEFVIDGTRRVAFKYTNNSDYRIIALEMTFSAKDDLTDEELALFDAVEWPSDAAATFQENGYYARSYRPVASGDTADAVAMSFWGYYIESMELYELSQPDVIQVAFLGPDDLLYIESIDCRSGEVTLERTVETDQWGTEEIADAVPRPEGMTTDVFDSDTYFSFYVIDVSIDDFDAYVQSLKDAGFTENAEEEDGYYYAEDADGAYSVDVDYLESRAQIVCSVDALG